MIDQETIGCDVICNVVTASAQMLLGLEHKYHFKCTVPAPGNLVGPILLFTQWILGPGIWLGPRATVKRSLSPDPSIPQLFWSCKVRAKLGNNQPVSTN